MDSSAPQKQTLRGQINELAAKYKASGNERDFELLYEALWKFGGAITKRHRRCKDEDLVSTLMLRFYRRVNDYQYPAQIFSTDLVWRCWRENSRTKLDSFDREDFDPKDIPLVFPFRKVEACLDLETLLQHLHPEAAKFLRMLMEGWSVAEIAGHLGIQALAAHARLRRIKRDVARIKRENSKPRKRRQEIYAFARESLRSSPGDGAVAPYA